MTGINFGELYWIFPEDEFYQHARRIRTEPGHLDKRLLSSQGRPGGLVWRSDLDPVQPLCGAPPFTRASHAAWRSTYEGRLWLVMYPDHLCGNCIAAILKEVN